MPPRHLTPPPRERNPATPPDSTDPSGPCPRCGLPSNFEVTGRADVTFREGVWAANRDGTNERVPLEMVSVLECLSCQQRVVVVEELYLDGVPVRLGATSGSYSWRGIHWWPMPAAATLDASVPSELKEAFAEGLRCQGVRAYHAAVVMYRRTLEAIVDARGSAQAKAILASRGPAKIAKAIQQMSADGDLTKDLGEWANDVRNGGNDGGHWDPMSPVTEQDAIALSALVSGLFEYLFVVPAKLSARRQGSVPPT